MEECRKITVIGRRVRATGDVGLHNLQRQCEKEHCNLMRQIGYKCPHLDLEVQRIISRFGEPSPRPAGSGLALFILITLDIWLIVDVLAQRQ